MFNKKKKIISELERQISDLKAQISAKGNEISMYKSRFKGDRVCSALCQNCQHAVEYKSFNGFVGLTTSYLCEFDNQCKDFKKKFIE